MFVLFFIELQTRRVFVVGCTEHPSAAWATQQARHLAWQLEDESRRPTLLIRDRDAKFPASFDAVFRAEAVRVVRTPVRAPRANAVAERWVGTVRRDCLDGLLIFGRGHLEQVLAEYVAHYNMARPHRALELRAPWRPGTSPDRRVLSKRSSGVIGWEGSFTSTSRSSVDATAQQLGFMHPTDTEAAAPLQEGAGHSSRLLQHFANIAVKTPRRTHWAGPHQTEKHSENSADLQGNS